MVNIASKEIHRDDSPMFTGTHKGASGSATLRDPGAYFKVLGCTGSTELMVENETQGTYGIISVATNDEVQTGSGVFDDYVFPITFPLSWDYGDVYNIYKTDSKNKLISSQWVDVSRGWKAEPGKLTKDGHGKIDIFGPGQPEKG